MIDLGINYIAENEKCYTILKKYNYINTLKFPGKVCNYMNLEKFLNFTKEKEIKIDLHGLPGMVPSFSCNSNSFLKNVNFCELERVFSINKNISRISTHVGIENKDKISNYSNEDLEKNWLDNYNNLKSKMQKILNHDIELGLENIPGGFLFDKYTITPEYVSENWKKSDFGVFDITHAKLSAKDLKISYEDYINRLQNIDKVKILHISGNIDYTDKFKDKPDKHVFIKKEEIKTIIQAIKMFKNLDLIVSEYAYNTKYSSQKETIMETITINTIVKTKNEEISKRVLQYLEDNLKDDISNIEDILTSDEFINIR